MVLGNPTRPKPQPGPLGTGGRSMGNHNNHVPLPPVMVRCRFCWQWFEAPTFHTTRCRKSECRAAYDRFMRPRYRKAKKIKRIACIICGKKVVPKSSSQKCCLGASCLREMNARRGMATKRNLRELSEARRCARKTESEFTFAVFQHTQSAEKSWAMLDKVLAGTSTMLYNL